MSTRSERSMAGTKRTAGGKPAVRTKPVASSKGRPSRAAPGRLPIAFDDVRAAAGRLAGRALRTPVLSSRAIDDVLGCRALLKCENLQHGGAFKYRGACNAIRALPREVRARGVIAYSSGNHAQAIALVAREQGVPSVIVMPDDAPRVKLEATARAGAQIVTYDRRTQSREAIGRELAEARGLTLIPPYDHAHVIAGQGTAALELHEQAGTLDALFVCVGGGGLISGCATAMRALQRTCRIIGVEPELADDATRSFRSGVLHRVDNPPTIADGARTPSLGELTFPIVRALVDEMVTVSEARLSSAMRLALSRGRLVVEPTGALALAGLLEQRGRWMGKRVGVVVSGGNVDLDQLGELLSIGAQVGWE